MNYNISSNFYYIKKCYPKPYTDMKSTKALLIFFLTFWISQSFAQEQYIVGVFRANPIGKFASTNLEDGGFAKTGFGILLENKARDSSWPEGLFFGTHFTYQSNELDRNSVEAAFNQELGGSFNTEVTGGNYNPFTITLGPFYDLALTEHVRLGLKSGIGFMITNIDPMLIVVRDDNRTALFSEVLRTEGIPTFTFLLGIDIGYSFNDAFGIRVFADYTQAKEEVKATFETDDISSEFTSDFTLNAINTGIRISFGF